MISSKSKYAFRALTAMVIKGFNKPSLISDLASEEKIPKKFLERILLDLKKAGLLRSQKGKGGGYYFQKDPSQISVAEVIHAVDGSYAPVSCVEIYSKFAETRNQADIAKCRECPRTEICPLHYVMRDVLRASEEVLTSVSISDLCDQRKRLEGHSDAISFDI